MSGLVAYESLAGPFFCVPNKQNITHILTLRSPDVYRGFFGSNPSRVIAHVYYFFKETLQEDLAISAAKWLRSIVTRKARAWAATR